MEVNLHFVITRRDGSQDTQDIKCPPEMAEAAVDRMLVQYAQVGMLRKEGTKYVLLPASQIILAECELPAVVLASPGDTTKAAAAVGGLKKIIT